MNGLEGMDQMAVGAVGGAGAARALAALQLQLQQDQRVLATDVKSQAPQQVIAGDRARIALTQAQLVAARQSGSVDLYL